VLLACLYLPTLATRFDFIDDGNLVYPEPPMPLRERLSVVWQKVLANYQHLGPFRPVLWAHWEAEAELCRANPLRWRMARLVWTTLAAGALLWLLRELGIRPPAAVLASALALWNPYRNEIWTSLTLSEGVAMPYALLALVCAVRASRSGRPWPWDCAGVLCVIAALGCKNTFAALVPAQVLLRMFGNGRSFSEGWRRHGRRALLLAATLLLPVAHYLIFKYSWHPGQYETGAAPLAQLLRMLAVIRGALSLDFMGAGLALALTAVALGQRAARLPGHSVTLIETVGLGVRAITARHRAACLAGVVLLGCGVAIYLPMDMVSGRYSMPAVWGADLLIASLLSTLAGASATRWKRIAYGALTCGLVAVAVANLGRQDKFAARASLLWQTLEWVEDQGLDATCLAWLSGPDLNVEEGIHFAWHLRARHRRLVQVCFWDEHGQPQRCSEWSAGVSEPRWLVSGTASPPPGAGWHLVQEFKQTYWKGKHTHHCYLWSTLPRVATGTPPPYTGS
jgi:hypothetical protein